jgi:glycosyltransferase involved in cell wall biosynthesis
VPRGPVAALASALARMAAADRAALGAAGRADAERIYAWPRVVEQLERVYEDARANHSG